MEGLFRQFPEQSIRFVDSLCKWSIAFNLINLLLLVKWFQTDKFDLASLWAAATAYRIAVGGFVVLRVVFLAMQINCRMKILLQVGSCQQYLLNRRRDQAVEALLKIARSSEWRLNHFLGFLTLIWIMSGILLSLWWNGVWKVDYFRGVLLFNIGLIVFNSSRTTIWISSLERNPVSGKLGGATQEEISKKCTVKVYSACNLHLFRNNMCMICQEDYSFGEKLRVLRCGHEYHSQCIEKWLCTRRECPYCKQVL